MLACETKFYGSHSARRHFARHPKKYKVLAWQMFCKEPYPILVLLTEPARLAKVKNLIQALNNLL
jgi:hypothetical protein